MKPSKEKLAEYKRINKALDKFIASYEPESPRFRADVSNMFADLIASIEQQTDKGGA